MDQSAEFDQTSEKVDWDEVFTTLQEVLNGIPEVTSPPPSLPPPVPAEPGLHTSPHPADCEDGGYDGLTPPGAAPQLVPAPVVENEKNQEDELPAAFAPPVAAAPPLNTLNLKKRRLENQQDQCRPFIPKPPNAFMIFLKEQRAHVEADIKSRGSAAVNTILGQRWKSLTKEEQEKYYEQANREQLLHSQLYPDWSNKDNYGKKRKRKRQSKNAPTSAEAPTPEGGAQQTKRLRVNPAQTPVMEPWSPSQQTVMVLGPYLESGVMESGVPRAVVVLLPNTNTPMIVPVCRTFVPGSPSA